MIDKLLIIGAGHLGSRIADLWVKASTGACAQAETRSGASSGRLEHERIGVRRRDEPEPNPAPFVFFCVPPSRTENYSDEAERAVGLWSGEGRLVMTSSTAVYLERDGGVCVEESPLASDERAARLLAAEKVVLGAGGIVVRLAGLYDFERGVHRYYQKASRVDQPGDGWVNLIHYDDAAALCLAVLQRGEAGRVYLGCDLRPMTRDEIVLGSQAVGLYGSGEACRFTGGDGPLGRRCDSGWTRRALGWAPAFESFDAWLSSVSRGR